MKIFCRAFTSSQHASKPLSVCDVFACPHRCHNQARHAGCYHKEKEIHWIYVPNIFLGRIDPFERRQMGSFRGCSGCRTRSD